MSEGRIEYRDRPRGEKQLWAIRVGTRNEIRESAENLLRELRGEYTRASVFVNGRRVQLTRSEERNEP